MTAKRAVMVAYTFYEMDNRVRRYGETLVKEGWHVDAVALRQPKQNARGNIRGVNLFRIQNRKHNERSSLIYLYRLAKFLLTSAAFLALRTLKNRYDLVHVHSVPDFEVFAAVVPKFTGSKVILDIHDIVPELSISKFGVPKESAMFRLLLLMERFSAGFADHVIIANHIWGRRIMERSVKPEKCTVIMNYPDPEIFTAVSFRKRQQGKFVAMYPGTLSKHQGVETAIRAVKLASSTIPEIELQVYGKGTDEEYFRDVSQNIDCGSCVRFMGIVSIEQIAEVMATADIGIEPKLRNQFSDEAFSTKILEFMMLGVPVIASDTSVHRHYLNESVVRFFRAGDSEELAEAIIEMYRGPETRRRYCERASQFVEEFSWEKRKSMFLEIVECLTG